MANRKVGRPKKEKWVKPQMQTGDGMEMATNVFIGCLVIVCLVAMIYVFIK